MTDRRGGRRRKHDDSDHVRDAHALRSALDEAVRAPTPAPVEVEIA
ncbi:hypothetical protein Bsp3421_005281 [Burkholderia sp. FERM BP-3421]|nr:hypothetical protein [Burkholderia sp. FERM BP-3421]WDD95119.1 hypothetical protein Bsp3421_005281 [Burkholderia sp. FERM BP-3421]